jgi:hypothetical protein
MLKIASGVEGKALTETIYSYDQQGRLQSIRDGARPESPATTFSYDEQGRKTKTQISRPEDYRPNTMVYGSPFETAGRHRTYRAEERRPPSSTSMIDPRKCRCVTPTGRW